MTKWLRRGMVAAVLAGGLATAGATAASGTGSTSGNAGLLNGNQINLPIQVPINVCGNAVGVLGAAQAECEGGASATKSGSGGNGTTSHNLGVGNGNQVNAPIQVPVNVCGNAIGNGAAKCEGGSSATNSGSGGGGNTTSGNTGILNGNQLDLPIQIPVNVCGNSVAVLGTAHAWCVGGASANGGGSGGKGGKDYSAQTNSSTSGGLGIADGNQIAVPIQVPITACGNSVAVLGAAAASCQGGATANPPAGCPAQNTSGGSGLLSGNQICAPIEVPVNVCGNAVGVAGTAEASCGAPAQPTPPAPGGGGKGALPNTGFSVGLPLGLAVVLLIGGSAAVLFGRKRQSKHTSA